MHCQHILFPIFLFIYIVTGILLAIVAYILHVTKDGYNKYGSQLSHGGRYYIGAVSLFILLTCIIQIIALICRKKLLILFRVAFILLIVAIILELTAVTVIVLIRSGLDPGTRKKTLIVASTLTSYLIILQIYGVIAILSYLSDIRTRYHAVSLA